MMDQLEFETLIEKIKKRKNEGDIKTALKVADKIPWDEVEDVNLLMYAASLYDEAENYRDAKALLEYAYEIAPVKNRLYFAFSLINAKCKDLKTAISYYIDFCESFPDDNRQYLLKYYILKAKGASYDQQKRVLSEYISEEKDEKMTFELALLCDKLEEKDEVLQICNYIVDFYGVKKNGYGKNALLLKKKYEELTQEEEKLLEQAEIGYLTDNSTNVAYTETPALYNATKIEEEKVNIPVEKVSRAENLKDEKRIQEIKEKNDDELDEESVVKNISISYTPDEESYREKEKNKMAFMREDENDKEKLRRLINELKEEERINSSEFNKFRQKSFKLVGRLSKMKLNETKLHMIIEAHSKDEGIEIAQKELNYIHEILGEKVSIAKASAYNMNEKGFGFYKPKIKEKDLIIENAGQLKNDVLDEIEEFIINKSGKTIFALVDVINNFDKVATDRPSFIGRFDVYSVLSSRPQETLEATKSEIEEFKSNRDLNSKSNIEKSPASRIESTSREANSFAAKRNEEVKSDDNRTDDRRRKEHLTGMSIEKFVEECKEYAKSIDCVMSSQTAAVLYEKAEEMRENNIPLSQENAVALIEEAADRAEKPKLFSKPKYNKEGCLILSEEHFDF